MNKQIGIFVKPKVLFLNIYITIKQNVYKLLF